MSFVGTAGSVNAAAGKIGLNATTSFRARRAGSMHRATSGCFACCATMGFTGARQALGSIGGGRAVVWQGERSEGALRGSSGLR